MRINEEKIIKRVIGNDFTWRTRKNKFVRVIDKEKNEDRCVNFGDIKELIIKTIYVTKEEMEKELTFNDTDASNRGKESKW